MKKEHRLILEAGEWDIRSYMKDIKYRIYGGIHKIRSRAELAAIEVDYVHPDIVANKQLHDVFTETHTNATYSIVSMLVKVVEEEDMGDGYAFEWLHVLAEEDAYKIVLTIRRFLEHQQDVHRNNMTKPSDRELKDYEHLKGLHNHVLMQAQDYLNRHWKEDEYAAAFSSKTVESKLDLILNGGTDPRAPVTDTDAPPQLSAFPTEVQHPYAAAATTSTW